MTAEEAAAGHPSAFTGTPRPRPRWHHATTDLEDFAIISFRVPPGALERHLPEGFAPVLFPFAGGPAAMVSAVAFRDRDFRFRFFPPAAISCGQINYRAYVTAPDGTRGVWFFQTSLDHLVVAIPRLLWRMPWQRDRIQIGATWAAGGDRWSLTAGAAACEAAGTGSPVEKLDGFGSDWLEALTHPTAGWYGRPDGAVGTYSIWHPVMQPRLLHAQAASFPVFERLGLIEPGERPHSVLGQAVIRFDIHTPPRRARHLTAAAPGRPRVAA